MNKSLVWLASYPKSGNTWTRIFLANYFANPEEPLSINKADMFGTNDAQAFMYRKAAGGDLDLNDQRRVLGLRDRVLRGIAGNGADFNFLKSHFAVRPAFGTPLIPAQYSRSAVYIVRNPLDVVLSLARHFGLDHRGAVDLMGRSDFVTEPTPTQVSQFVGSWSDHVMSWTSEKEIPVFIMRYEDMLADPAKCFSDMLRHIGIPVDEPRLEKAVRFSDFEELSQQESKAVFKEAPHYDQRFFAKGSSGQWKTDLKPELAEKLTERHREVMAKFDYTD